jgi:hypothetical protein
MSVRNTRNGCRQLTKWACCSALFATIASCERGSSEGPPPAFVPSWAEARQALECSLSAWRDPQSPPPASSNSLGVQTVDKQRETNQRLLSFQILGQSDIENTRQFTVRLNLEGEESPQLVKYNVLGREPVWVFRLDDYEKLSHWEHDMSPPTPGPGERSESAGQPAKTR